MLRRYLQRFFANEFYPVTHKDWYKNKNYKGHDNQERFSDFLEKQGQKNSKFYNVFQFLDLTRQFIPTVSGNYLDSVIISPKDSETIGKPGRGLYFIFFQGRGEYYESRFRDMAIQAKETGASVLGFNPKGFYSSTGKTEKLCDIVDDGISIVNFLLLEKKLNPNQIILQGNSLGGGVQEMVAEYFLKTKRIRFRQINSNSFKTLSAVIAYHYNVPWLEFLLKPILNYSRWEIKPGTNFYKTGPYRCVLRRLNDKIIPTRAEFFSKIDIERDNQECPAGYRSLNKWLYDNSQLVQDENINVEPHFLSLNCFYMKSDTEKKESVYILINKYLEESNKYV